MNIKMLLVLFLFAGICMPSIGQQTYDAFNRDAIVGETMPIYVSDGKASFPISDFFFDPLRIDSIRGTGLDWGWTKDMKKLTIRPKSNGIFMLRIWADGQEYGIPIITRSKKTVAVKYTPQAGETVSKVSIVGDLNGWGADKDFFKKKGNDWVINLDLSPGNYPYQIVVNDKWILDPANPDKVSNGLGGFNSVLEVKQIPLEELPRLYTISHDNDGLVFGASQLVSVEALINNMPIQVRKTEKASNIYRIDFPEGINTVDRTNIRIWGSNTTGFTNDLLIPLERGKVVDNPLLLNRKDRQQMIMYFTIVDRFYNGNKENDDPILDDKVPSIANYMGGDLIGIDKKIKEGYFKDLGVNTLWLSPITQNPYTAYQEYIEPKRWYSGYHGYWPILSGKIDHRLGVDKDLQALVDDAHGNEMNVLLDYVCNHVHELHPVYTKNKKRATSLTLPDGSMNLRIWDDQRLTTWFDTFLPTLDLSDQVTIELQSDSALYWIKKFNLDGFRHDATKHVPQVFWRTLTEKVKKEVVLQEDRPVFQIGETFGSPDLISSYLGTGQLEAQFDFNLYFDARDVFVSDDEPFERLSSALRESFDFYGYHSTMGNITGNHDLTRFMGLASGAVKPGDDPKEIGYQKNIEVIDTSAYRRLSNLTAFLMTIPGIPVIYYGDEFGMVGAGDPDNRRMMRFEDLNALEKRTKATAKKLCNLRRDNMALMYGDFHLIKSEKDVLVYARQYFDQVVIVAFNKGGAKKVNAAIPAFLNTKNLKSIFNRAAIELPSIGQMTTQMPAHSFEIWIN